MPQGNTTVADALSGTSSPAQEDEVIENQAVEGAPADDAAETLETAPGDLETLPEAEVIAPTVDTAAALETPVVEVKEEPPVVEAPAVEAPAVVAAVVPEVIVLEEKPAATSTLAPAEVSAEEKYLEDIRATGSPLLQRILSAIETFVEQMKPRTPITPEKGSGYQYEFLKHMLWLIERDYEEFRLGWNLLLVYFTVHHGRNTPSNYTALSEYSTHRFLNNWTRGEDQCEAYRNLITLLRATHNKKTRAHDIKTIMLEKIAPSVISAKGLDNLKKFYAV